jgi:hypothetical protein
MKEQDYKTMRQFLDRDRFPLDPVLPSDWCEIAAKDRPAWHFAAWGIPYIVTNCIDSQGRQHPFQVWMLDDSGYPFWRGNHVTHDEAIEHCQLLVRPERDQLPETALRDIMEGIYERVHILRELDRSWKFPDYLRDGDGQYTLEILSPLSIDVQQGYFDEDENVYMVYQEPDQEDEHLATTVLMVRRTGPFIPRIGYHASDQASLD